jgi:hypothetical protein
MGEARKVIFTFLILLFIIIGLGVLFSRAAKNKPEGPILGGIFDNIFFSRSTKVTPTPTPKSGSLSNAITIHTKGATPTPSSIQGGGKGGVVTNPDTIPATGTPTAVLALSGLGLSAGYFLKRFSH